MEEEAEEEGGEASRRKHGGADVCQGGTVAAECMAYGNSLTVENVLSYCRECVLLPMRCMAYGSASICAHSCRRRWCKDCGDASICPHNRRRSACKPLQGVPILIMFGNLRINNKREYATRIDRLGCYTN